MIGLLAGAAARFLMPGRDPIGCLGTLLLGVAGALLGGFLYTQATGRPLAIGFDLASFGVAVVGAFIVLLIYRLVAGRRV
ncbi:GlsB/YeaQ/YmgE family stress response membrane protein [Rubrobacter taiwanensis]|nr:GlsB/YeaQ/YmgE family stress response membrane protein [Rubrobacter taiwanensis]